MRSIFFIAAFFCVCFSYSQDTLLIKDQNQNPIAFAAVETENGTVLLTNKDGIVLLPEDTHTIKATAIGYQTKETPVGNKDIPIVLDTLVYTTPSQINLRKLIKKAINRRSENMKKAQGIHYNFYAKGSMEVTNYPKKFLGYTIDQLDPNLTLDSLKQENIFYSETISSVYQSYPNKHKETVKKHYAGGNSRKQNFLTALESDINFYQNIAYDEWNLISPLASNALSYYNYEYTGSFTDPFTKQKIHALKVIPLRKVDPTMSGTLYLVDKTFEIYAVEASIKGGNVAQGQVEEYHLKQQFSYNNNLNQWQKTIQTIAFQGKILFFSYAAEFVSIHSDYDLFEEGKDFFSNKVISYEHVKDSLPYFQEKLPLYSTKNQQEFIAKNERMIESSTQSYQDSLDRAHNKFNLFKLIIGYKNRNSNKNETYKYNGLLSTFAFNPVQGFNVTTGLSYLKEKPSRETFYEIGGLVNYGIAENKPRFSGYYTQLFDRSNRSRLHLSGGLTVHQFGEDFPVTKLINSIAASYFGRNFAKFYQKDFIALQYEQDVFNGLFGSVMLEYANRKPLFNNTLHSPFVKKRLFSSNNPLHPADFENPGFEQNNIVKLKLKTIINFDQKYIQYPHKKVNIPYSKYPLIHLNFETGFASTVSKYNYALIGFSTLYQSHFRQYGDFGIFANAGFFIDAHDIAFMDYKHFYGNETFLGTTQNYLQHFNLLPYYAYSTNKDFMELHTEHNFKGFLTNKIPLFNQLQWHLIVGGHALFTYDRKSYYELSAGLENVGFGNFRPFRIDFFQSFNGLKPTNGIIIGINLLDRMK